MSHQTNEDPDALLKRLSQKAGVQSILILSRETGVIVRASGLISSSSSSISTSTSSLNPTISPTRSRDVQTATGGSTISSPAYLEDKNSTTIAGGGGGGGGGGENGEGASNTRAEEVARTVWAFMETAAGLISGLNGEDDEMKLLRLRTKKNELVIVPDSKFLLVVIHDTPPA
ncbi:MAG: hypothetical protein M1816_006542 [Peltula sp. TS41687]|nr:MAG: hypothetical protein M1816_006542 [Peltula sp. TS41687]